MTVLEIFLDPVLHSVLKYQFESILYVIYFRFVALCESYLDFVSCIFGWRGGWLLGLNYRAFWWLFSNLLLRGHIMLHWGPFSFWIVSWFLLWASTALLHRYIKRVLALRASQMGNLFIQVFFVIIYTALFIFLSTRVFMLNRHTVDILPLSNDLLEFLQLLFLLREIAAEFRCLFEFILILHT